MIERSLPARLLMPLLLVVAMPSSAQRPRLEISAQGGPSYGWLRGNPVLHSGSGLVGAAVGATFQYGLTERSSLRLGVGYQQKGSSVAMTFTDIIGNDLGKGKVHNNLDYLMMPLLFRVSCGTGTRISAGLGPYLGYLIDARRSYSGSANNMPGTDMLQELERVDFGVSGSVGVERSLGARTVLHAEVRYDHGLADISALPVIGHGSIRTNAACLVVGLGYRIGSTM